MRYSRTAGRGVAVAAATLVLIGILVNPACAKGVKPKVTPKQAEAAALKVHPGKIAQKSKLENEDGHLQYEVFIKSGKKRWEVNVDALTGKVLDSEETSAAEEAREGKEKGKERPEPGERKEDPK